MPSKRNFTEAKTLEIYRITLANTKASAAISKHMSTVGYDKEKVAEGYELLKKTREAYYSSIHKKNQLKNASHTFSALRKSLSASYSVHRKTAKVAFRSNKEALDILELNALIPKAYSKWLDHVRKFYTKAAEKGEIQKKLSEFRLNEKMIAAELKKIRELGKIRADYMRKRGLAQKSTEAKDLAFDNLYEWMKDFYAVAKIAMRDNSKLMASFDKGAGITR